MKILVIDLELGLAFAMRCAAAGHDVLYYTTPEKDGSQSPIGNGLVAKCLDWEKKMRWADLIVVTGNSKYAARLEKYFNQGFPIFGTNTKSAALELDRQVGVDFLNDCGIETLPSKTFTNYNEAINYVKRHKKSYACKPWGGTDDKSLSYVADSPSDMVFMMERWSQEHGVSCKVLLQEKMKGIEVGVGGWLGPGGFCSYVEENFEHKKLMNDDLGCNTGEQGTVMRYVKKSELANRLLKPCEDRLVQLGFVGSVDINCMVGEDGTPWPLEFTMRMGWPAFNLNMSLHLGDPAEWMADLLQGKDTLRCKSDICTAVVMTHGDFPYNTWPLEKTVGFPITGITSQNRAHIWPSMMMMATAPMDGPNGTVVDRYTMCTAGNYPLVVTGHGLTVKESAEAAYDVAWGIKWPSNRMFRTDIGKRLEDQLPKLHKHGFCLGMEYE